MDGSQYKVKGSGKRNRKTFVPAIEGTKLCVICDKEKSMLDFHVDKYLTSGRTKECAECRANKNYLSNKIWRDNNPEAVALYKDRANDLKYRIKYKYKISIGQLEKQLYYQGNRCAICIEPNPIAIDHDHKCCPGSPTCGECLRGVLCQRCNKMLGNARDNIEFLLRAVRYLEGEGMWVRE